MTTTIEQRILTSLLSQRLISSLLLAAYLTFYVYTYTAFASKLYAYLGLTNYSQDPYDFAYAVTLTFLTMFMLPHALRSLSDFFNWFIFSILFAPAMVTSALVGVLPNGGYRLESFLTISFFFMIAIPKFVKIRTIRVFPQSFRISGRWLVVTVILSGLLLVYIYGSIIRFSEIEQIYDQRALSESLGAGRLASYLLTWQFTVFGAFALAYSIVKKTQWYRVLAILPFVMVYMINGAKLTFAVVGFFFALDFLIKRGLLRRSYLLMVVPLGVSMFAAGMIQISDLRDSQVLLFLVSQIFVRAIAIQAALLSTYVEFFQQSPLTYYSHITGISALVQYPYDIPLGNVIGIFLTGNPAFEANANFWATDGFAAFGYPGIIIIGVVIGFSLSVFDALSRKADRRFLFLSFIPFLMILGNVSFFTSLITGGGILVIVLASHIIAIADHQNEIR